MGVNVKVLVDTFNQEYALVGVFSVIVKSSRRFVASSTAHRVQLAPSAGPAEAGGRAGHHRDGHPRPRLRPPRLRPPHLQLRGRRGEHLRHGLPVRGPVCRRAAE